MVAGKACDGVWGYPPQGIALKKGTGEYPEKEISGEAPEKGVQGKPRRGMQGKALKDGGLTFKAGPREGEITRLLDGDFTGA